MQNVYVARSKGRFYRLVLLDTLSSIAHVSVVGCLVMNERRHPVKMYDTTIIQVYRSWEI